MPDTVSFHSPAKVNYYLRVTGRRPDGYHDLINVMCRITLFDRITMRIGGKGLDVACDNPEVPSGPENIVFKAIQALFDRAGKEIGVEIEITKTIPIQSGLGGASSNAASVMMRLNEMLKLGFSPQQLIDTGISIGSDVPFFLFRSPAVATGKGEILSPIEGIPEAWLVIVKPAGGISTREAYEIIDLVLTEEKKHIMIPRFINTINGLVGTMSNDFEPIALRLLGDISDIKDRLIKLGALGAMLSGSGSAVFGVFADEAEARRAYGELCAHPIWSVHIAKNLFD